MSFGALFIVLIELGMFGLFVAPVLEMMVEVAENKYKTVFYIVFKGVALYFLLLLMTLVVSISSILVLSASLSIVGLIIFILCLLK